MNEELRESRSSDKMKKNRNVFWSGCWKKKNLYKGRII